MYQTTYTCSGAVVNPPTLRLHMLAHASCKPAHTPCGVQQNWRSLQKLADASHRVQNKLAVGGHWWSHDHSADTCHSVDTGGVGTPLLVFILRLLFYLHLSAIIENIHQRASAKRGVYQRVNMEPL